MTAGVGAWLSKGAQASKLAVGLATKAAIAKAIFKETMVHVITGVADALVSIGADEISKVLIEEIADTHFVQYFEKWVRDNSTYAQQVRATEVKIGELYGKFGMACKADIHKCIQESLNDLASGGLGD
jgi:hypothetical protein